MKSATKRSVLIGATSGIVGVAIGAYVALAALGHGYEAFFVYSGAAAFVTSAVLWRWVVEGKARFKTGSGIFAGALSGVLSHYVCWYLLILSANLQHWLFANQYSSLGEPPLNVIEAIPAALVFSFWSLLFFGWITVPAGALIGASAIAAIKWRKAGNSAATRR